MREFPGHDGVTDTKIIYVVGFTPDFTYWHGDTARIGGYDWRPTWEQAADVLRRHLEDGATGRALQVPRNLTQDETTEWLEERRELFEVPMPERYTAEVIDA